MNVMGIKRGRIINPRNDYGRTNIVFRFEDMRRKVVSVVAEIEADKRARNVVPPYATMQELHRRLTPQELQQCATLVEQGRLTQYENINGPMYSVATREQR